MHVTLLHLHRSLGRNKDSRSMEDRRVFIKATNTLPHKNTNTCVAKFEGTCILKLYISCPSGVSATIGWMTTILFHSTKSKKAL